MPSGQLGSWEPWFYWGPDQTGQTQLSDPIHLVHVVPLDGDTMRAFTVGYGSPRRWRLGPTLPWYGDFVYEPSGSFQFCMGHSALADGRILAAGGDAGHEKHANLYNPFAPFGSQWNNPVAQPHMTYGRWYPTLTTLADGRVLAVSGRETRSSSFVIPWPELYTPPDWEPGNSANNTWTILASAERTQRR